MEGDNSMVILGERGLSALVKYLLDCIFLGGIGIFLGLPYLVRWYLELLNVQSGKVYYFLLGFLYITGLFSLLIVNEIRKIFKTLNRRNPFMMDNVKSLNRIAAASFIIAAAYVVKIFVYNSFLTIIIMMVFTIAGFFSVIFAEVFRQAVMVKEENDLTI
ncbi:MAG: DUF2975 domain-containing protein [Clostridia bacterium]|nr:DUF2975 domain-containing protein [Clostridia bacterium]